MFGHFSKFAVFSSNLSKKKSEISPLPTKKFQNKKKTKTNKNKS